MTLKSGAFAMASKAVHATSRPARAPSLVQYPAAHVGIVPHKATPAAWTVRSDSMNGWGMEVVFMTFIV